jgi:hypothetical protein
VACITTESDLNTHPTTGGLISPPESEEGSDTGEGESGDQDNNKEEEEEEEEEEDRRLMPQQAGDGGEETAVDKDQAGELALNI